MKRNFSDSANTNQNTEPLNTNNLSNKKDEIYEYIQTKKNLYTNLINFLENNNDDDVSDGLNNLNNFISKENEFHEEFERFLQLITDIADNCHRNDTLFKNIYQIIEYYENKIKQTFSNQEIFQIFERNKKILLFLFKKGIITIDNSIYNQLLYRIGHNGNRYCHFFYPEIKNFSAIKKDTTIEKELLEKDPNIFDNFEEKREEGENDTFICSLIRKDMIDEFVRYINEKNISLRSTISSSIFETNSFLNENQNITLIQYAAFFGSIQIFKYLVFNKVEIDSSLWIYAIHSRNAELFELLVSYNVDVQESTYIKCFSESIKCHHNEFAEYIENTFLQQNDDIENLSKNEEILSSILHFHNYAYFPFVFEDSNDFFYLYSNNYHKLVKLFLKIKEESIKEEISEKINIFFIFII